MWKRSVPTQNNWSAGGWYSVGKIVLLTVGGTVAELAGRQAVYVLRSGMSQARVNTGNSCTAVAVALHNKLAVTSHQTYDRRVF